MEYKFKTIYKNELIDCEISHNEGLVFSLKHGKIIGKYRDPLDGGLPLLKVYPYIGRKTNNKEYIYLGHLIEWVTHKFIYEVIWDQEECSFKLKLTNPLDDTDDSSNIFSFKKFEEINMKISGHVHLIEEN